jgi:hypothetical protein
MLKDVALSVSLANLCFYRAWRLLLNPDYYYLQRPRFNELAAITINVAALALLFLLGIMLVRRSGRKFVRRLARWVFLLALLLPLNGLRGDLPGLTRANLVGLFGMRGLLALGVCLLLAGAFVLARWSAQIFRAAVVVVLILSPFVLITFARGAWFALNNNVTEAVTKGLGKNDAPHAPPGDSATRVRRVVWILFDEMDERLAFEDRPGTITLPEFDRLRGESLFAARAYAATGRTKTAIPSLLIGKLICRAQELRENDLQIKFQESGEVSSFGAQPNVFTRARAAGIGTALAGWYHPYCRLLNESLTRCYSQTNEAMAGPKLTLAGSMLHQISTSTHPLPLVKPFVPANRRLVRQKRIAEYTGLLEASKNLATDSSAALVLLHLPVPHPPGIFDRAKGELSDEDDRSYVDNLVLADRTLGALRRALEETGLWESTTVLASSDHWWRVPNIWEKEESLWTRGDAAAWDGRVDHRVPFILKLAGQSAGKTYGAPFNAVLSQDLIMAVLRGEIIDADAASAWLDRHRSIADSPCN